MAIDEAEVQQQVRLAASDLGLVMWRNNVGALRDANGRLIRFGVGGNGGSDLIGYTPVEITQEMVGMRLPVFTAIEVKRKNKKATDAQAAFLERLTNRNGIAIVADDWRDLKQRLQASVRYPLGDSK